MKKTLIKHQLSSLKTTLMYKRQFNTLAQNVFEFDNLPKYINKKYLNKTLLYTGKIAFFYEEVIKSVVAFPITSVILEDIYGRPTKIVVSGENGYKRTLQNTLEKTEFVIMYDNNAGYPLTLDINQYAERYSLIVRTIDVNIYQQRTPRIWKVPQNKEKTFLDMLNEYDGFEVNVITYDDKQNPLEDIDCILEPAPFVADKLQESKRDIWSEFLRLIGVSDLSFQKKERNIRDEIIMTQGGAIASRFSRFEPRKDAVNEINEVFKDKLEAPIEVRYYDGMPTTEKESIEDTAEDTPINVKELLGGDYDV